MSVFINNYNANGAVYDDSTNSQIASDGPSVIYPNVPTIQATLFEINPQMQWDLWNPASNEFGKVTSVAVGAGKLVIGNPEDVTSGQVWITNYSGELWKNLTPSLYSAGATRFGEHIELGQGKILIGQPEADHNGFTNPGNIEVRDHFGNYRFSIIRLNARNENEGKTGSKNTFTVGNDDIAVIGSPLTKSYQGTAAQTGFSVEFMDAKNTSNLPFALANTFIRPSEWWTDQLGNTFIDAQDSSFGNAIAHGEGRFFIADKDMRYQVNDLGGPSETWNRTGGVSAWTTDGKWMRNYYYPSYELPGTSYPENMGRRIRVGSGYVGTTLDGSSGDQWHQPVLNPGGIVYWEINSGKMHGPIKMVNARANGGAFGTKGDGTSVDGDFDIGCGFIVGTANAAHSTNGTARVNVWSLKDHNLIEAFNIHPLKNNQPHVVEQVNIADGYVFICGEINGQGGFVYRYKLPQTVGSATETLLSTYINMDERVT
jgi:hypothetical protein